MTTRERAINLIEKVGIKQTHIAKQLNISTSYLSMYLNNKVRLKSDVIEKLEELIDSYQAVNR